MLQDRVNHSAGALNRKNKAQCPKAADPVDHRKQLLACQHQRALHQTVLRIRSKLMLFFGELRAGPESYSKVGEAFVIWRLDCLSVVLLLLILDKPRKWTLFESVSRTWDWRILELRKCGVRLFSRLDILKSGVTILLRVLLISFLHSICSIKRESMTLVSACRIALTQRHFFNM